MSPSIRAWTTLGLAGLLFFLVTAETFSSLGVVLPAMVQELGWSWSTAGIGFSLLGVFCGITSTVPASLIRHIGVRATLALGGLVMVGAFAALALSGDVWIYFLGCGLAGLGFTLLGTVPGTYLLARCFENPGFAIGLYFTVGGLGGVAGPLFYFLVRALGGGWRDFWIVSGALILAAALTAAFLVDTTAHHVAHEPAPGRPGSGWTARAALRTPQFAVLAAAYSVFLIVGITVNAVSVAHLMRHGVATLVAGSLISLEGLFNAGARLLGGVLSRFVDAKWLLVLSLGALIVGLLALCVARSPGLLLLYAAGIGIGYGLTFFSSTILLLEYFGRAPNLELFAIVNVISTVGSVGPAFAGIVSDHTGSFVPALLVLAVLVLAELGAVLWMKPPGRAAVCRPVAT